MTITPIIPIIAIPLAVAALCFLGMWLLDSDIDPV